MHCLVRIFNRLNQYSVSVCSIPFELIVFTKVFIRVSILHTVVNFIGLVAHNVHEVIQSREAEERKVNISNAKLIALIRLLKSVV